MSEYTKRERGDYTLPGQEGKGFQKIPNEIWHVLLRFQGSRHELQVFEAIFELTVNWKHEWQRIANKTLGSKTRISPNKICEATRSLVKRKMIRRDIDYAEDSMGRVQRFNAFSINPKVSEWDVSPKSGVSYGQSMAPRFDAIRLPDLMRLGSPETGEHPRYSLQKSKIDMLEVSLQLANLLFTQLQKIKPKFKEYHFKHPHNPPELKGLKGEACDIQRMINEDHRSPKDIEGVINWFPSNGVWRNRIKSAGLLRGYFDDLYSDFKNGPPPRRNK
jgi:phage replication O-like protein O